MPAALEREPGDRRVERVAADDRDRPRDAGVAEHREVEVEPLGDRRHAPQRAARGEVAAGREVELHERARRERAGLVVREHDLEEPGLEHRDARAEPVLRREVERVADVGERVRVHVLDRRRQAVAAGAAEVHRARVDERRADQALGREHADVRVAVGDRRADAGRRVEDRARPLVEHRAVAARVLLGPVLAGARSDRCVWVCTTVAPASMHPIAAGGELLGRHRDVPGCGGGS